MFIAPLSCVNVAPLFRAWIETLFWTLPGIIEVPGGASPPGTFSNHKRFTFPCRSLRANPYFFVVSVVAEEVVTLVPFKRQALLH